MLVIWLPWPGPEYGLPGQWWFMPIRGVEIRRPSLPSRLSDPVSLGPVQVRARLPDLGVLGIISPWSDPDAFGDGPFAFRAPTESSLVWWGHGLWLLPGNAYRNLIQSRVIPVGYSLPNRLTTIPSMPLARHVSQASAAPRIPGAR